jgi:hypothetical protein
MAQNRDPVYKQFVTPYPQGEGHSKVDMKVTEPPPPSLPPRT